MKGTREGRRLFAGCLGIGAGLGLLAGIGAAVAFHTGAGYLPCHPDIPQDMNICREVDLIGFQLRSSLEAALTVGVVVALIGWVLAVVAVLYSASQQQRHPGVR